MKDSSYFVFRYHNYKKKKKIKILILRMIIMRSKNTTYQSDFYFIVNNNMLKYVDNLIRSFNLLKDCLITTFLVLHP